MKDSKIIFHKNFTPVHPVGATYFVTCALKGSIAEDDLWAIKSKYAEQLNHIEESGAKEQVNEKTYIANRKFLLEIDEKLNENHGPNLLASPEIARVLLARIESLHMRYYKLLALSILPNHFHMLIDTSVQIKEIYDPNTVPKNYIHLKDIVDQIKEKSAIYIKHYFKIEEQEIWENESFDTFIRDEKMLNNIANYIKINPIKAGLIRPYEEHPFTFVNDF